MGVRRLTTQKNFWDHAPQNVEEHPFSNYLLLYVHVYLQPGSEKTSISIKTDTSKLYGVIETWYTDISEIQVKQVKKEKQPFANKVKC